MLKRYHPLALRWFLLASQYRAPLNYSDRGLDEASDRLYYVVQVRLRYAGTGTGSPRAWAGAAKPTATQEVPVRAGALEV